MALASTDRSGPLLNSEQMTRYSRQILLDEVGVEGQRRLLDSSVLLIGAGGLGAPAAIYLAAAGVGTIGIIDGDRVELSNLHRQVIHFNHDVGRPKTQSARRTLEDINPDVNVVTHQTILTSENAREIIAPYDVVLNGCDNFATRYLVNDACVLLRKPLVDASILKWEGQATVFMPGKGCYRCLYPEPPPPGEVPSCAEGGIIGALAGHMGTRQAIEAIKILLGVGEPLANRLFMYDALTGGTRELKWRSDPACPICGDHPTITDLIDYEAFCGIPGHATGGGSLGVQSTSAVEVKVAKDGAGQANARQGARTTAGAVAGTGPAALSPGQLLEVKGQRYGRTTADGTPEVSVQEAQELLESGGAVDLVDVREPWEYRQVHATRARLVPKATVPQRLSEIDPGKITLLICRSGSRSAEVTRLLRQRGYERVYNVAGGTLDWVNHQLPTESENG